MEYKQLYQSYTTMAEAAALSSEEREEVYREFRELVNMTPDELKAWMQDEKYAQTIPHDLIRDQERVKDLPAGPQVTRNLIEMLSVDESDYMDEDYAMMRKAISFIKHLLAHHPADHSPESHWRYALMTWGHDPAKPDYGPDRDPDAQGPLIKES